MIAARSRNNEVLEWIVVVFATAEVIRFRPDLVDSLRPCFTTHLLKDGYDIRTAQELVGHKNVSTTMIYTHVLNRGPAAVRSPADRLPRS